MLLYPHGVRLPHHNLGVRALWTGTNVREGWFELAPTDETSIIAGRAGRANGVTGTGGRQARKVSAAEKHQAREVSLRRIGAAVRAPTAGQLAVVVAIIVASSHRRRWPRRSCSAAVIDDALPRRRTCTLLVWLVVGMVAVAAVTAALGVVQTWICTQVGQQVMHGLRTDVFAHLQRQSIGVLHPHPHRRGAVAHHQRHRRHAVRGHLDRDLDRLQPHHRRRHRRRHGRAVLAAVADLAGGAAAGDLPDPQGRPDAPRDHRAAAARAGRPQRHHRGGAVGQRRAARQDDGRRPGAGRAGSPPPRPG